MMFSDLLRTLQRGSKLDSKVFSRRDPGQCCNLTLEPLEERTAPSVSNIFGTGGKVITPFSGAQVDGANRVLLEPDGKIVVVGTSSNGGPTGIALARYTTSGSLDPTFGSGGKVFTNFPGHTLIIPGTAAVQ